MHDATASVGVSERRCEPRAANHHRSRSVSAAVCLVAAVLLSACAQSSGVHKLGPDTYSVSVHAAPMRGGEPGARSLALTEANAKCAGEGKEIVVTNTSSGRSTHLPGGTVEITFQCLTKGDPDLRRPSYRSAPSAVIEDRRSN